jgi:alcohol dehydrogenase class IV
LLLPGRGAERTEGARRMLLARGVAVTPFVVEGEPTIDAVKEGAAQTRYHTCDLVIGFGGGSVTDAAKAIAALATNRHPTLHYLEVIGLAQPLLEKPLPMIAVPTTAGTGSEVTRNAVLTSPEHKMKVSLRHASMLPAVALLDPELTYSVPPMITATTGLDALAQLIEPFVSTKANPLTDALCREGISMVAGALSRAIRNGTDAAARCDMMMGSLLGGLALANAGLGAVHGFASPLGGMLNAPHGGLCAALLPGVIRVNSWSGSEETKRRYEEVARLLGTDDAADWVERLLKEFGIVGLRGHGATEEQFPEMIEKAKKSSSMKANPVELTDAELTEILRRAM